MTVYTARDLQNAYMSATAGTLSIGQQEFLESYGRYAYFTALKVFQTRLAQQYGGDIAAMAAAARGDRFIMTVNHLITDIDSDDYLNRALGYGDQNYNVAYDIQLVNGEYQVALRIDAADEDYEFVGKGESSATEFLRTATKYLLDPLGLGKTIQVDYTGDPVEYVVQAADIATHAATYDALTAEGRNLIGGAFSSPAGLNDFIGHILVNSPEFFYTFPEAGVTLATTVGAIIIGGRIVLARADDGTAQTFVLGDQPLVFDADGNLAFNTLSDEFSGIYGLIPAELTGTAFENFLPSTLLNANGGFDVDWDWSTIDLSDVTLAASIDTSGYSFNYITVPGITVTSTAGDWRGTFAQTQDGVPIFQIAANSYGITQTALAHADGSVTVFTDNGSTTGQFNYTGSVGANADPFTYFGNTTDFTLQDFTFIDNASGETIGEGTVVGGSGTNQIGGGAASDTLVARIRDVTSGEWQTTVTYVDRSTSYTGQQIGDVFGSALGQLIDTGNVFADITAQTALRRVLANVGETIGLYFANDGSMMAPGVVRADYSLIDAVDDSFGNIDTDFALPDAQRRNRLCVIVPCG